MSYTWILIANASQARIYSIQKAKLFISNHQYENCLDFITELEHEKSRKKTGELITDRLGSYQTSQGGHGSYVEPTDPKEVEADRFAKEIAEVLDQGRLKGEYEELVIVATPHFQGLLKKHLNHVLSRMISNTIEKDYTQYKERELAQQLREQL
jgi:protein required for attachment to host cells